MKRIPIIFLIIATLMLSGGCADIDWKLTSKQFFANLLETTMQIAITEYGGQKMEAIQWTINYVEQDKFDWARPVMKWIDYQGLIEHAYDRLWANWYGLLREAKYDTDAFMNHDSKIFALMDKGVTWDGLQDELIDMMEPSG